MKNKISVVLLVALLVLTAATGVFATSFVDELDCKHIGDSYYTRIDGSWTSHQHSGAVYVYHNVDEGNSYTNHFRVYVGSSNSASANKWVTPGKISGSAVVL